MSFCEAFIPGNAFISCDIGGCFCMLMYNTGGMKVFAK
ncbi:hypothetical protein M138_3464 [Bacteroides fragilis str. S23L17]|nr:hypothetical protein M138_3464 [Bacteroides fragilis str. S23L17]